MLAPRTSRQGSPLQSQLIYFLTLFREEGQEETFTSVKTRPDLIEHKQKVQFKGFMTGSLYYFHHAMAPVASTNTAQMEKCNEGRIPAVFWQGLVASNK